MYYNIQKRELPSVQWHTPRGPDRSQMSHGLGFWWSGLLLHMGPWVYFTTLSYCVLLIFSRLITQRFEGCVREREKPLQLFLHWLSSLKDEQETKHNETLSHNEGAETRGVRRVAEERRNGFLPRVRVIGKTYIFREQIKHFFFFCYKNQM